MPPRLSWTVCRELCRLAGLRLTPSMTKRGYTTSTCQSSQRESQCYLFSFFLPPSLSFAIYLSRASMSDCSVAFVLLSLICCVSVVLRPSPRSAASTMRITTTRPQARIIYPSYLALSLSLCTFLAVHFLRLPSPVASSVLAESRNQLILIAGCSGAGVVVCIACMCVIHWRHKKRIEEGKGGMCG